MISTFRKMMARLKPPGPMELGRSDYDALPMRGLGDWPGAYTWEDWEEEVRAKWPIRFWITHTFPSYFWPLRRWVRDGWYWLKCKTLPSYKFHIIDLRNPGPGIRYTHGWRDQPDKILWAAFICLREYIEKEEPRDPASWASAEELAEPHLAQQKAEYDEAMALYNWWMSGRLEEDREENRRFEAMSQFPRHTPEHRVVGDMWRDYREWREEREQEMLERLIRIRRRLWT